MSVISGRQSGPSGLSTGSSNNRPPLTSLATQPKVSVVDSTVQSIEIAAAPESVFAVAADLGSYTQWASGVRSIEILETDANGRAAKAHFVVDGMVKEIEYTLNYTYDPPNSISWTAEAGGDFSTMEGSYTFNRTDEGGTEVVYALMAAPAFTIPGFLRRQVEKTVVGTALRGLRRRVEDLATG